MTDGPTPNVKVNSRSVHAGTRSKRRRGARDWLIARGGSALTYLTVWVFIVIIGFPIVWMVMQSFKSTKEMYRNIWGLPHEWRFENYVTAWEVSNIGRYIFNSVFISTLTVLLVLVIASLASYAFAKMRFRGRRFLYVAFILSLFLPVPIIPLYAVVSKLNLSNTHLGLILPYTAYGLSLSIFLLTAFFEKIPRELEDAAKIDGCSDFKIYTRIILPLSKPGLATVTIFQFVNAWNEFFLALVLVRSKSVRTIPVGLQAFFYEFTTDWSSLFAALSISTIPIIIVYVAMQKQFIAGLTAGAVKG